MFTCQSKIEDFEWLFGRQKNREFAFTLVEIIVVIAIIAVLSAMAFPVFSSVRKNSLRTACISNLRQIHSAISLYIQDYDGEYPAAINPADRAHPERWKDFPEFMEIVLSLPQFHEVMLPYTKSKEVFHCPADDGWPITEFVPGWEIEAVPSSYIAYGTSYFYKSELTQLRASDPRVTLPSETLVLMDADGQWHGSRSEPQDAGLMRRYNVLFADGHVRNITHETLGHFWDPPIQ